MRHAALPTNAQSNQANRDQRYWSGFGSGRNSRDKPKRWIEAPYQAGLTVSDIQSDDLIVEVFKCINNSPYLRHGLEIEVRGPTTDVAPVAGSIRYSLGGSNIDFVTNVVP